MRAFVTMTELLPHQGPPVEKLLGLKVGALFMDMGTGKSRTVIEFALRRAPKIDRVIWFCPVSLKDTVYQQIVEHTDCGDIYVFNDKTDEDNIPDARWYIIGIESMSSSARTVFSAKNLITERSFVILDESSYIKGHRAKRTERITVLSEKAKYRMILTGTPVSQGVVDLFSQMRFLSPKILRYSSFYSFSANHLEYSERYPGMIVRSLDTGYIAARIKPYVYQVTKDECFTLPDKLYETRYFAMTDEQYEMYESAKEELLSAVEEENFDSYTIFRLYGILQQILSGFWHKRITENGRLSPSDRFETLYCEHRRIDTLTGVISEIPENGKIVIWAKFKYDIWQIKKVLEEIYGNLSVAQFHGGIPERERNAELQRFRSGARFLIATQSAGGHGLNINEASYAIFYNNGFKYSERSQAEERCRRFGQTKRVTYIDICCPTGIDRRISDSLTKKENVADNFKMEVDKIKDDKAKLKEMIKEL